MTLVIFDFKDDFFFSVKTEKDVYKFIMTKIIHETRHETTRGDTSYDTRRHERHEATRGDTRRHELRHEATRDDTSQKMYFRPIRANMQ